MSSVELKIYFEETKWSSKIQGKGTALLFQIVYLLSPLLEQQRNRRDISPICREIVMEMKRIKSSNTNLCGELVYTYSHTHICRRFVCVKALACSTFPFYIGFFVPFRQNECSVWIAFLTLNERIAPEKRSKNKFSVFFFFGQKWRTRIDPLP